MVQLNNVLDILKLLEKSNCRECGETTCLALPQSHIKEKKNSIHVRALRVMSLICLAMGFGGVKALIRMRLRPWPT